MGNSKDDCFIVATIYAGKALDVVFMHHLFGIDPRVVNIDVNAILFEFVKNVFESSMRI